MGTFKAIFKFEFFNYIKSKPYIIITIIFVVLALGASCLPRIFPLFSGLIENRGDDSKAAVLTGDAEFLNVLKTNYPNYEWISVQSREEIEEGVASAEFECGLEIGDMSYTVYQEGTSIMAGLNFMGLDTLIKDLSLKNALVKSGGLTGHVQEIMDSEVKADFVTIGKDVTQSFWYAYVLLFMLYIAIILYGQYVMTSVVTEKSSKMMELLITSAKPLQLMFGKVIGTGAAGLTQFVLLIASLYVGLRLNYDAWVNFSPAVAAVMQFSLNANLLPLAVLFFLLGFFLYAFVFAGMGSTVSRIEDANAAITLPMLLFVSAFLVSIFGMMDVTAGWVRACSLIPFFTPMVMFMRVCLTEVPVIEIIISIILTMATVFLTGFLGARIYRAGVMMYGKPPKLKDIAKYIFKPE